jgi:hypothetical protein
MRTYNSEEAHSWVPIQWKHGSWNKQHCKIWSVLMRSRNIFQNSNNFKYIPFHNIHAFMCSDTKETSQNLNVWFEYAKYSYSPIHFRSTTLKKEKKIKCPFIQPSFSGLLFIIWVQHYSNIIKSITHYSKCTKSWKCMGAMTSGLWGMHSW